MPSFLHDASFCPMHKIEALQVSRPRSLFRFPLCSTTPSLPLLTAKSGHPSQLSLSSFFQDLVEVLRNRDLLNTCVLGGSVSLLLGEFSLLELEMLARQGFYGVLCDIMQSPPCSPKYTEKFTPSKVEREALQGLAFFRREVRLEFASFFVLFPLILPCLPHLAQMCMLLIDFHFTSLLNVLRTHAEADEGAEEGASAAGSQATAAATASASNMCVPLSFSLLAFLPPHPLSLLHTVSSSQPAARPPFPGASLRGHSGHAGN